MSEIREIEEPKEQSTQSEPREKRTRDQAPSARTQLKRAPQRGAYDRETIDAILDEGLI